MLKIFSLLLAISVCCAATPIQEQLTTIVRPCHLSDYRCIGDNLAANSQCNPAVQGYIPNKYKASEVRFETPGFNSSYVDRNLIIRNHDKCFVSDFVINTELSSARLVIDCPDLDLESDRTLIQHKSFYDDSHYHYHIRGTYPLVRFSLYMLTSTHMNLCKSRVFTDVTALPRFHVDPKDKPTAKFLTKDLSLLNFYERESLYYKGYFFVRIFVDSLLCGYGCRPTLLGNTRLYGF